MIQTINVFCPKALLKFNKLSVITLKEDVLGLFVMELKLAIISLPCFCTLSIFHKFPQNLLFIRKSYTHAIINKQNKKKPT